MQLCPGSLSGLKRLSSMGQPSQACRPAQIPRKSGQDIQYDLPDPVFHAQGAPCSSKITIWKTTKVYYVSQAQAELNKNITNWPNVNTQVSVDTGTLALLGLGGKVALFPL